MGIDNRLIAMAGQVPDIAGGYIASREAGLKHGAIERQIQDQNRMSQILSTKPANMPMSEFMSQQGMGDKSLEYGKQEADISKTQAEAQNKNFESHLKQLEIASQFNQGLMSLPRLDKQTIINAAQQYAHQGLIKPEHLQGMQQELAKVPDDDASLRQLVNSHIQTGLKAAEYMRYQRPDANAQLSADTQRYGQDLSAQTQMRGQDLTALNNERGYKTDMVRLNRDIQNDEFRNTIDTKKYQLELDKYNNPAKSSKPTEAQSKAALYANRMQEAESILSSFDYSPAAIGTKEALSNTPLLGGMLGAGANMVLSKDSQKAEQAQRNFINAVLRRESGAVISPTEFESAKRQYFPSVGDSKEVLVQKEQNRRTAIESLKAEAQGMLPEMSRTGATESYGDDIVNKEAQRLGKDPAKIKAFLDWKAGQK